MKSRTKTQGFYDGLIRHDLSIDQDRSGFKLHRLDTQDCAPILDHNNEVMAQGGSRTGSFGKVELCIPELELYNLKKRYPDLESKDKEIRVKAWKKYIATAEARPWKVSQNRYV